MNLITFVIILIVRWWLKVIVRPLRFHQLLCWINYILDSVLGTGTLSDASEFWVVLSLYCYFTGRVEWGCRLKLFAATCQPVSVAWEIHRWEAVLNITDFQTLFLKDVKDRCRFIQSGEEGLQASLSAISSSALLSVRTRRLPPPVSVWKNIALSTTELFRTFINTPHVVRLPLPDMMNV